MKKEKVTATFQCARISDLIACFLMLIMIPLSSISYAYSPFKEAYFRLEANVFDRGVLQEVIGELNSSVGRHDKDPWESLCASLVVLVSGYKIGDWYSEKTFVPGTADRALEFAETAKSIAPELSQSHAHYARVLIIQGKYKAAWGALNRAYELDSESFYPWYFRGIIAEKMRDADGASGYFDEAEQRITLSHQGNLVSIHRQKVARFTKKYTEQENLLKQNIAKDPNDPIRYGNYAHFLMERKRYEEAIEYWEKAVDRGPYPHAVKKLAEVRQFLESKRQ